MCQRYEAGTGSWPCKLLVVRGPLFGSQRVTTLAPSARSHKRTQQDVMGHRLGPARPKTTNALVTRVGSVAASVRSPPAWQVVHHGASTAREALPGGCAAHGVEQEASPHKSAGMRRMSCRPRGFWPCSCARACRTAPSSEL